MNPPSTYDRSWNDPPFLKFEMTGSTKKRTLLTKRVSDIEPKAESTSDNCEESCKEEKILDSSEETTKPLPEDCLALPDEEALEFVSNILKSVLNESTNDKIVKDINRRLDVMAESWDSKLSKEVKDKMFRLAQEIGKGNIDAALQIQCSLMVQNVREVKGWMVGIKHIIEMKKETENVEKADS